MKGIITNAWVVDLRKEKTNKSKLVSVLKKDDVVDILEKQQGYYKIRSMDNVVGFISEKYLEEC